jgi:hypothetical protein
MRSSSHFAICNYAASTTTTFNNLTRISNQSRPVPARRTCSWCDATQTALNNQTRNRSKQRATGHKKLADDLQLLPLRWGDTVPMCNWASNDRGKLKDSEKNPSQWQFVRHKSHMDWPGHKLWSPSWDGRRPTAWPVTQQESLGQDRVTQRVTMELGLRYATPVRFTASRVTWRHTRITAKFALLNIERHCRAVGTAASSLGGPGFKSRLTDRLSWGISWFASEPPSKCQDS